MATPGDAQIDRHSLTGLETPFTDARTKHNSNKSGQVTAVAICSPGAAHTCTDPAAQTRSALRMVSVSTGSKYARDLSAAHAIVECDPQPGTVLHRAHRGAACSLAIGS